MGTRKPAEVTYTHCDQAPLSLIVIACGETKFLRYQYDDDVVVVYYGDRATVKVCHQKSLTIKSVYRYVEVFRVGYAD